MTWTPSLFRGLAAAWLACAALAAPAQQAYPNKPLRILVPFPGGGSLDQVARLVGEKLTLAWGQPVVVDNRPGGNTVIGTLAAAKAPPDGHTILLTASTHVINPLLMANLPYDSDKDFIPVAIVIQSNFVLVVNPSVPANNLQEFITYVKARPDKVDYASSGQGNGNHIAAEMFNQIAGTKMKHVPYKGGSQATQDVLGGVVPVLFSVPSTIIPHVKSGKLRALAYTGSKPPRGLTGVPSFAQAGLPAYDLNSWQGFMLPAGTPKPIVDKLAAEIMRIMADPELQEKLAGAGQEVWINGPEAFATIMKSDAQKFGQIIRTANIKLDQ
jgi:tripartite-type tricarboxylate transporter receptor subunit TctC